MCFLFDTFNASFVYLYMKKKGWELKGFLLRVPPCLVSGLGDKQMRRIAFGKCYKRKVQGDGWRLEYIGLGAQSQEEWAYDQVLAG